VTTKILLGLPPETDQIKRAAEVVSAGGLVAYPTDTLYALGVDPRRDEAVANLCAIKERGVGAGLPLIAASVDQVERCLGPLSTLGRKLAAAWWPGPLTLVFAPTVMLPDAVHASDGSLAVRVPARMAARMLAAEAGHPLTATSANRRGAAPAPDAETVRSELGPAVQLVLEGQRSLEGAPSTIVDVRREAPRLLRAGSVPWEHVLQSTRV